MHIDRLDMPVVVGNCTLVAKKLVKCHMEVFVLMREENDVTEEIASRWSESDILKVMNQRIRKEIVDYAEREPI